MEGKDYWDRLRDLKLYSQERRRDRYPLIFLWKFAQGLVQGYSIAVKHDMKQGRMAEQKTVKLSCPASVRNAV